MNEYIQYKLNKNEVALFNPDDIQFGMTGRLLFMIIQNCHCSNWQQIFLGIRTRCVLLAFLSLLPDIWKSTMPGTEDRTFEYM